MSLYGIDNTVDEARILISKNCWGPRVPAKHEFIDEENPYTQSEFWFKEWRPSTASSKQRPIFRRGTLRKLGSSRGVNSTWLILWWIFTIALLWLMPFLVGEKAVDRGGVLSRRKAEAKIFLSIRSSKKMRQLWKGDHLLWQEGAV